MKKAQIIKSSFRMMGRYKLRTFFMMIGILVGITALTLIFSIGKGTEKKVLDDIESMFNSSSIMITSGGGRMMSGPQQGSTAQLTIEDLKTCAEEITNISMWDPMQLMSGREVKYKENARELRIWAYSEQSELVWNRGVSRGEYFDKEAVDTMSRVALIGEAAAKELFEEIDPLEKQILIGSVPFRIIGILEPMGVDPHGMDRDDELYVPITTAMRRLMNVDIIMAGKFLVKDPKKMEQTVSKITAILRERHYLDEGEPDDFSIMTPVEVREMVASTNKIFNVFLPLIAALSLLVGGVIASNLMLISVNERKSEIGLRKAIGAKSKDILFQFFVETIAITAAAGILGIIIGTVGVQALASVLDIPPIISWKAIGLGIVFSNLVGLGAGILPALRAASLLPVDALR